EPHLDLLALTPSLLKASAIDRATSRAYSWMSRGILRDGSFGRHCGLSGHTSQSSLLARYSSVLPSCTVPLVPSRLPPRVVLDVAGRIADAMQRAQRRPSLYSSVPLPRTGPELAQRTASWAER